MAVNKKKFINPYNFIPFDGNIKKNRISREAAYGKKDDLVSGWLIVEIDTKTPLIIPDGVHPKYWDYKNHKYVDEENAGGKNNKLHKEYDFLRNPEGTPIIPGSELRGMLRSVYEAVTDSCIPFLLDEKPISRRVPVYGALRHRGLLAYENEHWILYKAKISEKEDGKKIYVDRNDDSIKANGKKLWYNNGDYVKEKGWAQYNIPVDNTKYNICFLEKEDEIVKEWEAGNDEPYIALKSSLQRDGAGQGKSPNEIPNKNLQEALKKAKNNGKNLVPVYYISVMRDDEKLVYLSNSSIGRIAQKRKWDDIMGDYAPCSSTDELCPACLLFGTTNGKGLKGRIQVTDALPDKVNNLSYEKHTLGILATPRTSAFEFYLRKPTDAATFWNLDFYGESEDITLKNGRKQNRISYYDLQNATPRGRKMYWHCKPAGDVEPNNMNCTVEAVNGAFQFKVYFNEITKQQLNNLIWVITLGENKKDGTLQHKLGHARPLGYGSVKLQVVDQTIRHLMYDKDNCCLAVKLERKSQDELEISSRLNNKSNAESCLLKMADAVYLPDDIPVMYPREKGKKEDNIYTWFAKNRNNAKYVKTLPEPDDADVTLLGDWNERIYGKVKFYDNTKNFGIITGENMTEYSIKCDERFNPGIRPEQLKKNVKVSFVSHKFQDGKFAANQCRVEEG